MTSLSPLQPGIFMIQCSCALQVKLCECLNCVAMGRTGPSPKGCVYVSQAVNDPGAHPLPPCRREGGLSASRHSVRGLLSSALSLVYSSPLLMIYLGSIFLLGVEPYVMPNEAVFAELCVIQQQILFTSQK